MHSTAQHYHPHDYFITLTCNQQRHLGVCKLKEWIDRKRWMKHFPNFDKLSTTEQEEIETTILQAAGGG